MRRKGAHSVSSLEKLTVTGNQKLTLAENQKFTIPALYKLDKNSKPLSHNSLPKLINHQERINKIY